MVGNHFNRKSVAQGLFLIGCFSSQSSCNFCGLSEGGVWKAPAVGGGNGNSLLLWVSDRSTFRFSCEQNKYIEVHMERRHITIPTPPQGGALSLLLLPSYSTECGIWMPKNKQPANSWSRHKWTQEFQRLKTKAVVENCFVLPLLIPSLPIQDRFLGTSTKKSLNHPDAFHKHTWELFVSNYGHSIYMCTYSTGTFIREYQVQLYL